jgi:hypothetical protein
MEEYEDGSVGEVGPSYVGGRERAADTITHISESLYTVEAPAPSFAGSAAVAGPLRKRKADADEVAGGGPTLTREQALVEALVIDRKNVFFTGCAGTGKRSVILIVSNLNFKPELILLISLSFTLGRVKEVLLERYGSPEEFKRKVAITATTGIAATHIDGVTLNSIFGCGVVQEWAHFNRMWGQMSRKRIQVLLFFL